MNTYTPDSNRVIHYANVDFTTRNFIDTVHLVQYDNKLPILAVRLFQNGTDYDVSDADRVQLRYGKHDRTFVILDALGVSENGSIVFFELNTQITVEYGEHEAIIDIIFETEVMNNASSVIPISIDKNPVQSDMIESLTDYKCLVEYRNEALEYKDSAYESAMYLLDYLNSGLYYQFVETLPEDPSRNVVYLMLQDGETSKYNRWVYGRDDRWHLIGTVLGDLVINTDVSIAPEDWNTNTREVVKLVNGVSATNKVYVFADSNDKDSGKVYCKSQGANQLTFGIISDNIAMPTETVNFSIQIINPVLST